MKNRLLAPPEPWLNWVLDNAQMGVLVLDQQGQLVFANKWFLARARLEPDALVGRGLTEVFPDLAGSHLDSALTRCLQTGFATVLSNSLHPSPFPLYQPMARREADRLLKQSVHILPMGPRESELLGQRYVLIQINDVTQAVVRERLLKAQAATLHSISRIDPLTGIGNRRMFDEKLAEEFRLAARHRSWVSLVLFDIDQFKRYNDAYGHPAGDECLTLVSDVLRKACRRPRDLAARYGGEELALILPETDLNGAHRVALDVLQQIHQLAIPHGHNPPHLQLTMSAGAAALKPANGQRAPLLLDQADRALYQAKQQGRNRVCLFVEREDDTATTNP